MAAPITSRRPGSPAPPPRWFRVALSLVFLAGVMAGIQGSESTASSLWKAHVQPLLSHHCYKCHGELKQKNGLDLTSPAAVLKGGDSGPALVPGHPDASLLYQSVLPGAEQHMPPKDYQLTSDEIALVKMWIAALPASSSQSATTTNATNAAPSWSAGDYNLAAPNSPRELPPGKLNPSQAIDWYIEQEFARFGSGSGSAAGGDKGPNKAIKPSPIADDATFVRRVYLDLVGRIPTAGERQRFLDDRRRARRELLVDQLLADPAHASYLTEVFDVVLMGKRSGDAGWRAYLEWSFRTNRPWNQMVRDVLVARAQEKVERGAVRFLYDRKDNHQAIAEAVSPAFFGVQIQCAQCHNHPLAPEIKQAHYWGLVAFFNRGKNVDTSEGPAVAESAIGGFVKFANLKKESQDALLTFLTGRTVPELRPGENEKESDVPEKYRVVPVSGKKVATVPKFSRREEFATLATQDNPLLARAFVNRAWALMFGRGLVHPVDRMDSTHPPSHPDLLQWLARDFERSGYDIHRLVRHLVLTRAYQRDSVPSRNGPRPPAQSFAAALEKPIPAEALRRSMRIAVGGNDSGTAPDDGSDKKMREMFAELFPELFPVEYSGSLKQALFLTNNPLLDELLKPEANGLTRRLLDLKSDPDRIREAFCSVLGRDPSRDEFREAEAYLRARRAHPAVGLQHLVWALLTGAEFRFTH